MKGIGGLAPCVALGACLIAGCGRASGPAAATATVASPVSSSTYPPAPKSSLPPSFPPCPPVVTASPGIDNNGTQVGPDSWDIFRTSNQWLGPINGSAVQWYHVYAGMSGDFATPPFIPAVWVDMTTLTQDRCTINQTEVGEYFDSGVHGPLVITAVIGNLVYLRTNQGERCTFDLTTHRFGPYQ